MKRQPEYPEGTFYPLLTRRQERGNYYPTVGEESTSGPLRKYFSLTPKGAEFYKELETTWFELPMRW